MRRRFGVRFAVRPHSSAGRRDAGLTLVELMVALALGLLVAGAAIAALLVARRGFNNVDSGTQLRENVRFAASVMERIVVQAGYYDVGDGQFPQSGDLPPLLGFDDVKIPTGAVALPPTIGGFNGSDALSIGYFGSSQGGAGADGSMIDCAGVPEPRSATRAISIFSIAESSSGEPTLACTHHNAAGAWETVPLVSGVESLQILYGVDNVTPNTAPLAWSTNDDTVADRYLRASQLTVTDITTDATKDNWRRVRSVRIGLVVRGPAGSAMTGVGPQALDVLGAGFTSNDDNGSRLTVADDGRLRQQLVFTVHLRNPQNPGVPPPPPPPPP